MTVIATEDYTGANNTVIDGKTTTTGAKVIEVYGGAGATTNAASEDDIVLNGAGQSKTVVSNTTTFQLVDVGAADQYVILLCAQAHASINYRNGPVLRFINGHNLVHVQINSATQFEVRYAYAGTTYAFTARNTGTSLFTNKVKGEMIGRIVKVYEEISGTWTEISPVDGYDIGANLTSNGNPASAFDGVTKCGVRFFSQSTTRDPVHEFVEWGTAGAGAEPPATPINCVATPTGPQSWSATAEPGAGGGTVSSYTVSWSIIGDFSDEVQVTGLATLDYTKNDATPSTNYSVRFRAVGPGGTSGWSNVDSALTTSGIPNPPTNPTATGGPEQVTFGATDASSDETSFTLRWGTDGTGAVYTEVTGLATPNHTVTGLVAGTTYYGRWAAVNSFGTSSFTALASAAAQSGASFVTIPAGTTDEDLTKTQAQSLQIVTSGAAGGTSLGTGRILFALASGTLVGVEYTALVESVTGPVTARTVYGPQNTFIPLSLDIPLDYTSDVNLTVIPVAPVRVGTVAETTTYTQKVGTASFADLPPAGGVALTGSGLSATLNTAVSNSGTFSVADGGDHTVLVDAAQIKSGVLGLDYAASNNVPPLIGVVFEGSLPAGAPTGRVLAAVFDWEFDGIQLQNTSSGGVRVKISDGTTHEFINGPTGVLLAGAASHTSVKAVWIDNIGGAGGSVEFYINDVLTSTVPTTRKPRVDSGCQFLCNAIENNAANGMDGLKVKSLGIVLPQANVTQNFTAITATGNVSAATARGLVLDARTLLNGSGPHLLSHRLTDGSGEDLTIRVGPYVVPAGQAYKVRLENWSTGAAVTVGTLVLTKVKAQNCKYEDTTLKGLTKAWIETIAEEGKLTVGSLDYYAQAIRIGDDYCSIQFGYDFTSASLATTPFGTTTGIDSYMVPHKWVILTEDDTVLATIHRGDGEPINKAGTSPVWEGTFDGNGLADTTAASKWWPHGHARQAIIWRNRDPDAFTQAQINSICPRFTIVPFGAHSGASVNGGDLRVTSAVQGNNGVANTHIIPLENVGASTYLSTFTTASPYSTSDIFNSKSVKSSGLFWMRATPFNMQGRRPLTSPGGIANERQAMHDVLCFYADNIAANRAHDGVSWKSLAIHHLDSWAADPVHSFEGGLCVPLYKGNQRRGIGMTPGYYGPGLAGSYPESNKYDIASGQPSDWTASTTPLRVVSPRYGIASNKPTFSTYGTENSHAHQQHPGFGSLLFKTPEWAMLQARTMEGWKMWENWILGTSANRVGQRDGAWPYLHMALAWKNASRESHRLYTRAELLGFMQYDFERFYDAHWAAGIASLPAGYSNATTRAYVGWHFFGPGYVSTDTSGFTMHQFYIGYWQQALAIGEFLGFNNAVRGISTKCQQVLDWLISLHKKRVVGSLVDYPRFPITSTSAFVFQPITSTDYSTAAGVTSALPSKSWAELKINRGNQTPTWLTRDGATGTLTRDGQSLDQLMQAPSMFRHWFGDQSVEITNALTEATTHFDERVATQTAKGTDAGRGWFLELGQSNTPVKARS